MVMTFRARPRENALALFAKKTHFSALVSRRLRRTRIPLEERISWPSRSSRSSCLVFQRPPGGFQARTQPRGLTACAALLALSVACGGGGGEAGAPRETAPAA